MIALMVMMTTINNDADGIMTMMMMMKNGDVKITMPFQPLLSTIMSCFHDIHVVGFIRIPSFGE